ncbi:D-alanine--D-alanine ligase [Eggerthellaceae bacterium 3-80]|nr:D-alanine--D-alanine ligase [bacterium D16-34]
MKITPSQTRVALLAGGRSGERQISLMSGRGAKEALVEAGFNVTELDPANKEDLKELIDGDFDIAFLCLHGKYGEDGAMQGFLEVIGLPYIGSNVWSSALAMDKAKTKVFYKNNDIYTPTSITLTSSEGLDLDAIISEVGETCVVKPSKEGSTLGVYIVSGKEDLQQAIQDALTFDDHVLVESYVKGKELTVAVVGNDKARALPIIEIIPTGDFYDFDSKYKPGGSSHVCPAEIDADLTSMIQEAAVNAHNALGCRGVSRTDFILDDSGKAWALETNTLPGMTATSLLPDAARASGQTFSELCKELIELALEE